MSFGYSISDFIAIGEFALRVYREYRDAPAQFAAISSEVGSLHLVLKDVDSTVRERDLSPEKEADLIQICNGCRSVLTDLDALLQKYRNGSVITASSMKAAQGGDESIWREIRRELEDAGITEEMIYEHREFIATWV
ncbi:hypothetical protein DL98DRAFT_376144, partial [Cadophora sp. DSE1049]